MRKLSLPDIFDILFYTTAVWFLSFGLLRYYRVALATTAILSVLFALGTGVICALILYAKRRKRVAGKKEKEARDKLMLHLALEKEERVRAALLEAYVADGKSANCEEDALRVENEICVPLFTMQPASADAVALILRKYHEQPFFIACNALAPEAEQLLASFGKKAVRGDDVYALFARTQKMPEALICGEVPRRTVKQKLRRSFSKRNARPFFVSGSMLLLMSLFTFFPLYYLISGAILMLSAVFVRALGYA